MRRHARRAGVVGWVALLLAALVVAPANATRIRSVALAERSRVAGRIVVGRVSSVRLGSHPRYSRVVVTNVTVRVRETWKGAPGQTLSFMQFGDASATGRPTGARTRMPRIPGLPSYRVGEEILLFLYPPSAAGLTSPVGGLGGKNTVRRDPASGAGSVGEATLYRGEPATGAGTTPVSLETARGRVAASLREGDRRP